MFDPSGPAVLGRDECLALLASARLGRVVFTTRGLPAVEPVKFRYRDEAVYFATDAGGSPRLLHSRP